MLRALQGLGTIWLVIGAGMVLAQLKVLDEAARRVLARTAFLVAMPVLLLRMMSRADLSKLFTRPLAVSALAIVAAVCVYVLVATLVLRRSFAHQVIGALVASYTNLANIGLPIATYVLGDATWIAPVLLLQVGVLQPIALVLLDVATHRGHTSLVGYLALPFRNPITVGVLVGVTLSAFHLELPAVVGTAMDTVGSMAVPMMLVAYGVSLRTGGASRHAAQRTELAVVEVVKLVVQPLCAYGLSAWLFHLDRPTVLAVTVLAALPAATNIHVMATRYAVAEQLARDAVFWSTVLSVPVVLACTWLLA